MSTVFDVPAIVHGRAPIESALSVRGVDDGEASAQVYTNAYPLWKPAIPTQNIFGGLLIGQAINAAYKTVDTNLILHHINCSFLGAANAEHPLFYRVANLLDSRNYAHRVVTAHQRQDETTALFACTCNFQRQGKHEDLLTIKMPPTTPPPTTKPTYDAEFADKMSRANFLTHKSPLTTRSDVDPFIWHPSPSHPDTTTLNLTNPILTTPSSIILTSWVIPRGGPPSPSPPSRRATLGCLTDCWLIYHTADMLPTQLKRKGTKITKLMSINHNVWFHTSRGEFDDWMVVEIRARWGREGRVLFEQHVWDHGGGLVLSCVQEAVVRVVMEEEGKARM